MSASPHLPQPQDVDQGYERLWTGNNQLTSMFTVSPTRSHQVPSEDSLCRGQDGSWVGTYGEDWEPKFNPWAPRGGEKEGAQPRGALLASQKNWNPLLLTMLPWGTHARGLPHTGSFNNHNRLLPALQGDRCSPSPPKGTGAPHPSRVQDRV